jgi:peptidoglycan/xylan/chitin deacetylase (PgdA/CDA1 family)
MDNEYYDWSPIVEREHIVWPNRARVAFCPIINLEHMEWKPPAESYQPPGFYSHYAMQRPMPEFWTVSHREYGHRIGIFRILDLLERHSIPATVAMDAMTAANYPYLVRHIQQRGCEIIAHGISASRMITSRMNEDEERAYIREALDTIAEATHAKPRGWHGPEFGESTRTPLLLAEAGLRYVCDWGNDEQPYAMKTSAGPLYSLPIMVELDDLFALRDRRFQMDEYVQHLKDAIDAIYRDAKNSGRLFVLNLHPWLIGQPFRIRLLVEAIEHIVHRQGVWPATGSEIIAAYSQQRAR